MTGDLPFPYKSYGLTEKAVWNILHGKSPPLDLSPETQDLPIDIISDSDGRVLAQIHPKYARRPT